MGLETDPVKGGGELVYPQPDQAAGHTFVKDETVAEQFHLNSETLRMIEDEKYIVAKQRLSPGKDHPETTKPAAQIVKGLEPLPGAQFRLVVLRLPDITMYAARITAHSHLCADIGRLVKIHPCLQ